VSYEPYFLVVSALLIIMAGISKAGFGAGAEMAVVPIMALFIQPQAAAAIVLPILLVIDAANLWRYRGLWNRKLVFSLVPAAIIGICIGAMTFQYLNADVFRIALGVLALIFVAYRLMNDWLSKSAQQMNPPGTMFSIVFGAMAGFTSFVAHAGSPPAKIILLRHSLPKQSFVATNSYLFASINGLKLIPYVWLGQITVESLKGSLALFPFIPIGVILGFWLNGIVSEKRFTAIIIVALTGAGLKLLWDGATALM
jgi:uncharacterized membrane protein YfcA